MHWLVGALCWAAVALMLGFALCKLLGLWTQATSWLKCSKEEKANLTRSGIYNADGFLMKSDFDDCEGNDYQRFDIGDTEYPMTTMTIFPIKHQDSFIPPQPLRPAPVIIPKESKISNRQSDLDENKPEKSDSFYHYNISTASTQSFISSGSLKDLNHDCISTSQTTYSHIPQKQEKDKTTEQDDLDTRNNLNIYQKPNYTSTNPFLSNEYKINGQVNPFYSPTYTQNTSFNGDPISYDDIAIECGSSPMEYVRKKSYDDSETDETVTAVSSGTATVRRAISCDSVSSDTSLGPLESPLPAVTGQLCLSLRCFRLNSTESLLAVNVIEARNLQGDNPDTYVGIFLSPEHKGGHFKSKVCRGTNCPSYNETFLVDIGKINKKLCFHIYNIKNESCSLIGETELSLQDASSYKQPVTTWLTLTDAGQGAVEFGELMLSLSYLPTAERFTLILTRARRLPDPTNYNIFVKVYLQRNGKKVAKKRSSIKRSEISPTFNEAFIFSVPPNLLSSVELRVTLVYFPIGIEYSRFEEHQKIGHVILYHDAPGKPGNHWNQMISSLRKPVSMWHTLRRSHM